MKNIMLSIIAFLLVPFSIACSPSLDIPDQYIEFHKGYMDNVVDLWDHVSDSDTLPEDLQFTIVSQSAHGSVDCAVDSNRYIDCFAMAMEDSFITVRVADNIHDAVDSFSLYFYDHEDDISVDLIYPDEGDVISGDVDIRWNSSSDENLAIDILLTSDGVNWEYLIAGTQDDGIWTWDTSGHKDLATYQLKIVARADSGSAHDTSGKFTIYNRRKQEPYDAKEKKESSGSYDLSIRKIIFLNPGEDYPSASGELDILVEIENTGGKNLDDLNVHLFIPELGRYASSPKIDLDKHKTSSARLSLDLPDTTGEYDVLISVSNNYLKQKKYRMINILDPTS